MKAFLLLLTFMVSFSINAQELNLPKNPKKGEQYMYCVSSLNGETLWRKTLINPTQKTVKKIQFQLIFLGYKVVETGVLDVQTKKQLKVFNENNNLGSYEQILYDSQKLMKKLYKKKKKISRKTI
ncbi:hypothetical protein [uncultured Lacinutrix sp.]|uniref:hypothetical protein n=1 Tax=uncultured Lacinutrix sp. TaxID=574032 RepID=UPI00260C283E|nr:hypothetical protein [uncultured Lacinutrix sp.]